MTPGGIRIQGSRHRGGKRATVAISSPVGWSAALRSSLAEQKSAPPQWIR